MQKLMYLIIALLWSTQAAAEIELKFASSSARTIGQMQCFSLFDLEDITAGDFAQLIIDKTTGVPVGDEIPGSKGGTTVMVFDDNGALFARDSGGSDFNVASNLILHLVENAEDERSSHESDSADATVLNVFISPENFTTGLLVFTWSGTGFAELFSFVDLPGVPFRESFWRCEGRGVGEITIPIRVH